MIECKYSLHQQLLEVQVGKWHGHFVMGRNGNEISGMELLIKI